MAAEEAVGPALALTEKGALVESLWHAVDDAAGNLEAVPGLIRRVLETEAWRQRVHRGKTYQHARFVDFIVAKPMAGCGWSPDKVEALIRSDTKVLALWRDAVTPIKGTNQHSDNITTQDDGRGTSRSYTVSRLKRERPDLFERVATGEMSANAAAIEAGFRKLPKPRLKNCPHCGGEL